METADIEPRLTPADEDIDVETFLRRVIDVLCADARHKDALLADAVLALHDAGDHESADRIEREASPF